MRKINTIYHYRSFILSSIKNNVINRFIRSKLGGLWSILNPLSQVAIYALILSNILSTKLPGIENKYAYSIYLMSGLLAWNLFNEIILKSLDMFINNGDLIKKMRFPKITIPLILLGESIFNNILLLIAIIFIFFILGHDFTYRIVYLIPFFLMLPIFSISIGIILGLFNVFIRDIGQIVPILLQVLFWFTPIAYPLSIIPEKYQYLLDFNIVSYFTRSYQTILAYDKIPSVSYFLITFIFTVALLFLSLFIFKKANSEMVDVL
ncbi:ABC transporter permease [Avibacterium avium]|uniref:ABC transporter permease n=1 Tax=Avibacterium TaxID=292486 RepID=UPI002EDA01E1